LRRVASWRGAQERPLQDRAACATETKSDLLMNLLGEPLAWLPVSPKSCQPPMQRPVARRIPAGRPRQRAAARAARLQLSRAVVQRRIARRQVAPRGGRVGLGRRQRGRAALQLCALLGGGRLRRLGGLHSPGTALQ